MDLGIKGRRAIVCAGSKGLGRGCAEALAREGAELVITARGGEALEATAKAIRDAVGVTVKTVQGDITTEKGRADVLAALPDPDILITNAGGPPQGEFSGFELDDWRKAVEANMLTPIALIKAVLPKMIERRFGRVLNITSYSVKAPIARLELSNGARAGLTGALASLSRRVSVHNVTINHLLPGPFDTDRIRGNWRQVVAGGGATMEELERQAVKAIPAGRLGTAAEFGAFAAFLCSVHAGFTTGQSILLDGGSYPGTL